MFLFQKEQTRGGSTPIQVCIEKNTDSRGKCRIILFGKYGVIGFAAIFGLMYSAVIKAGSSARLMTDHSAKTLLIGHSLIVAVIMIDQIPNDSMNSLFWLIIGALIGRSQAIKTEKSIVTIPEIRSKIYGAL